MSEMVIVASTDRRWNWACALSAFEQLGYRDSFLIALIHGNR